MSSFVGHALAAGTVFACGKRERVGFSNGQAVWLGCLVLAAAAPDLDYFIPFLSKTTHGGIRISHSFGFAMVVPTCATFALIVLKFRGRDLWIKMFQIYAAGASHVVLDYFVGVHPMPLFWPLSQEVFVAPVGLLPSAGHLDLTNFYLYRNLVVELGILVPFFLCIYLLVRRRMTSAKHWMLAFALLAISVSCMFVAMQFSR